MVIENCKLIKDFPKPGIVFVDINPIFKDQDIFNYIIREMADLIPSNFKEALMHQKVTIFGIESRGFLFASRLSGLLNCPMVLCRKLGKLPGEVVSEKYECEYASGGLELQTDCNEEHNTHAIIIDDIAATNGTLKCANTLVRQFGFREVISLSLLNITNVPKVNTGCDQDLYLEAFEE